MKEAGHGQERLEEILARCLSVQPLTAKAVTLFLARLGPC